MEDHDDTRLAATMLARPRQTIRLARQSGYGGRTPASGRFVQQSHALSTPIASPRSLVIAAALAFALYLLGRRLSD